MNSIQKIEKKCHNCFLSIEIAIDKGCLELLYLFLDRGDEDELEYLIFYCFEQKAVKIINLLYKKYFIEEKMKHEYICFNMIMASAEYGNFPFLKKVLKYFKLKEQWVEDAIRISIKYVKNKTSILELLLKYIKKPDNAILKLACKESNLKAAKFLLKSNKIDFSAYYDAAFYRLDDYRFVKIFIEAGIDYKKISNNLFGDIKIMKMLLSNGYELSAYDNQTLESLLENPYRVKDAKWILNHPDYKIGLDWGVVENACIYRIDFSILKRILKERRGLISVNSYDHLLKKAARYERFGHDDSRFFELIRNERERERERRIKC